MGPGVKPDMAAMVAVVAVVAVVAEMVLDEEGGWGVMKAVVAVEEEDDDEEEEVVVLIMVVVVVVVVLDVVVVWVLVVVQIGCIRVSTLSAGLRRNLHGQSFLGEVSSQISGISLLSSPPHTLSLPSVALHSVQLPYV
jgi:hypothetical protein